MSWKATAYVKELTSGISHTEKLLLFVLADYHNTAKRIAWPSLPVLAQESLMSERNARRILAKLERKGLLRRTVPTSEQMAAHETSYYEFPALDDVKSGGQNGPPKVASGGQPGGQPGGHGGYRNKEEPVLEPVLEPVIPCNLHPIQYAVKLLEEIGFPDDYGNKVAIAAAIECEVKRGKSLPSAYEFVLAGTLDGQNQGFEISKFFFTNAKYRVENRRKNGDQRPISAAAERSERSKRNILDGFAANARRSDPSV